MAQSLRNKLAILSVPLCLILLAVLCFFAITQRNTREVVQVDADVANKLLPSMYEVPTTARKVSVQRNWSRDPTWFVKFSTNAEEWHRWKKLLEQKNEVKLVEVQSVEDRLSGYCPPTWFNPKYRSCRVFETDFQRGPRQQIMLILDEAQEMAFFASVSRY